MISISLALASSDLGTVATAVARSIGETLPLWSVIPFAGVLLSIALLPLFSPHFWHHHYPKVSLGWALLFLVPFLLAYRAEAVHELLSVAIVDYIPFITMLWGLFTVSGGLLVRGTLAGTPLVNVGFLLAGTCIASWVGTTGAAMLLIRPVLRANAHRRRKSHVIVFFIFLVANIGGCLTPLGDPPLFLGLLHGVPFFWTLRHLLPHLVVTAPILLGVFYLIDRHYYLREEAGASSETIRFERGALRITGWSNLAWLAGIVGAVLLSGMWHPGSVRILGVHVELSDIAREGLIVTMALLSLAFTPGEVRRENGFSWEPIREVAILFAAIFATIIPALAILKAGEDGHLAFAIRAVRDPWQLFWASGTLSSFLDNAPTYLTYFNLTLARLYPGLSDIDAVSRLATESPIHLAAISVGSVFMGANTYIGNAPNFMVKAIAEEAGVTMPSFFGYVLRWSLPILIPTFLLVTWIFF
jgi:Na+/H+ antiporter NhaD/arsenite permease-like protein